MLNGTSKVLVSFEKSNSRLQGQQGIKCKQCSSCFPSKTPKMIQKTGVGEFSGGSTPHALASEPKQHV